MENVLEVLSRAVRLPRSAAGQFSFRRALQVLRAGAAPLILFERDAGIGDIICTVPAVTALRTKYPDCKIVYATNAAFGPIVRMARCADAVVECDWSKLFPKYRKTDFDLAFAPRTAWERWERGERTGGTDAPRMVSLHLIDEYCQAIGVTPLDRQVRLHPPEDMLKEMRLRLSALRAGDGPIIGIHVGPSWPVRQWTDDNWEQLVHLLRATKQATVIQFGFDRHVNFGRVLSGRIPGAVDWVGKLTLEQTTAAIACLSQFVGIDSGLIHIAGAVGTPTVGLFGPVRSSLRLAVQAPAVGIDAGVPCAGCHHSIPPLHWRTGCPHDIECMKAITPEAVLEQCLALLDRDR